MINEASIEIGIPAYNEAANIEALLRSILDQVQDIYHIDKVLIISDGSSDDTVDIAHGFDNKLIEVIAHPKRAGKSVRMQEIFDHATRGSSHILVMLDADTLLEKTDCLTQLIRPIINGVAALSSGRPKKIDTGGFTDRVMNVSLYLQDEIKRKNNNGQSVYACHGRIVAMNRSLFSKLHIPNSSVGNDAYLYFFNMSRGEGFAYAEKATALFKMPQSFADYAKQRQRFSVTPEEQAKAFQDTAVLASYHIPPLLKLRTLISACFKYHIYVLAYICYQLLAKLFTTEIQAKWEMSTSTKRL